MRGKGSGKRGLQGHEGPKGHVCVKVGCPDLLVQKFMGHRGSHKVHVERKNHVKISVSQKEEYYPGTAYRVMAIYGDEVARIYDALDAVILKTQECVDAEAKGGQSVEQSEFSGKDDELLLRLCITKGLASSIIGPGGSRISEMRKACKSKITIDNEVLQGHQLARIAGKPESLTAFLDSVAEMIASEAENPDYAAWAADLFQKDGGEKKRPRQDNGAEAGAPASKKGAWVPNKPPPAAAGAGSKPGSKPVLRLKLVTQAAGKGGRSALPAPPPAPGKTQVQSTSKSGDAASDGNDGEGAEGAEPMQLPAELEERVSALAETVGVFEEGEQFLPYSVSFPCAACRLEALLQEEFFSQVEDVAGAEVKVPEGDAESDDPWFQRQLSVIGPLLNIYYAHMLILKRIKEIDRDEREAERLEQERQDSDPDVLKAKIKELQAALAKERQASTRRRV